MSRKPGWIWKIYFLIWAFISFVRLDEFFSNASASNFFYHFLIGVEVTWIVQYSLHALAEISGMLMLIPLFLYIYGTPCMTPKFWQWLFALKLGLDLWFRPYDLLAIKSLYHGGYSVYLMGLPFQIPAIYVMLTAILTFVFPAYCAFFLYAFNTDLYASVTQKQR